MNAETLHSIVIDLINDLDTQRVVPKVSELATALRNAANSPGDANYQQQVGPMRAAAVSALRSSRVNRYPAAWTQYLWEMGIAGSLGDNVAAQIEESFTANAVTIATVADDIARILASLEAVDSALRGARAGLVGLGIGTDDLQPGEVEIGFLIPRNVVREELGALAREYGQLKLLLGPFLELAEGTRPEIKVKGTSSSDFGLWLEVGVRAARIFGHVTAVLMDQYKQLLEIRKLRSTMEQMNLPADISTRTEEHAQAQISEAIASLTATVMADYGQGLDPGRANEVRADLQWALTETARRIDLSYSIQVRSLPPAAADDDEGVDDEELDDHEAIEELQSNLEYRQLEGSPVLGLAAAPPPTHDEPGAAE